MDRKWILTNCTESEIEDFYKEFFGASWCAVYNSDVHNDLFPNNVIIRPLYNAKIRERNTVNLKTKDDATKAAKDKMWHLAKCYGMVSLFESLGQYLVTGEDYPETGGDSSEPFTFNYPV